MSIAQLCVPVIHKPLLSQNGMEINIHSTQKESEHLLYINYIIY